MIYIGTAGWAIPSRYRVSFPGSGSTLERYARQLNSAEINSSFNRHHRPQTYERWAASVPSTFRFSVKVPRTLTHEGELTPVPEVLDRFTEEVRGLGERLAVLLVQLPPKLAFDRSTATRFFGALRKRIDVPLVCEPRHASWGLKSADRLLARLAVARVAADPPPWPGADKPGGFTGLAYFRWHGQPRKYYSDYGAEQLASLEAQITDATRHAADTWAVFDNTAHGYALGNALEASRGDAPTVL